VFDDLHKVASALAVPASWLLTLLGGGMVVLVAAIAAHSRPIGLCSAIIGVALLSLGLRAVVRPSQPFDPSSLNSEAGMGYINTSRRVGGFYAVVGVVWVVVSLAGSSV
jgi:hypothetical protein